MPKGLRPIRTTSGRVTGVTSEDDNQLKGFAARLRWARQQCLRQSGNPQAAHPTPARVGCLLALYTTSLLSPCFIHLSHVCPVLHLLAICCQVLYLPVAACLSDFISTCCCMFVRFCVYQLLHVCLILCLLVVTHVLVADWWMPWSIYCCLSICSCMSLCPYYC